MHIIVKIKLVEEPHIFHIIVEIKLVEEPHIHYCSDQASRRTTYFPHYCSDQASRRTTYFPHYCLDQASRRTTYCSDQGFTGTVVKRACPTLNWNDNKCRFKCVFCNYRINKQIIQFKSNQIRLCKSKKLIFFNYKKIYHFSLFSKLSPLLLINRREYWVGIGLESILNSKNFN